MNSGNGVLYRHYKGGLYVVLHSGRNVQNEDSKESVVVYQSCKDGAIWVRTVNDFCSEVILEDGAKVARFQEYKN